MAEVDIEAVVDRLDVTRSCGSTWTWTRWSLASTWTPRSPGSTWTRSPRRLDLDAVVERLDLDAVIARLDLVGIAENVIAEVDLPEIIRESTGSVASEAVRGVRMQRISGDEAVGRAIDRLRLRRGRPAGSAAEPGATRTTPGVPPQPEPGATTRS